MKDYVSPEIELNCFEDKEIMTMSYEDNEGSYPNGWN